MPAQVGAALRARDERSMVIAGPINLVQGGRGLIGRLPVFVTPPGTKPGSGPFWGLVSAVIDVDKLFGHAGLHGDHGLEVALRGVDGRGAEGAMIEGETALFERDPVLADVIIPGDSWQLAAIPRGGWVSGLAAPWLIRSVSLLLAVTVAVLFLLRGLQRQERVQARRRLEHAVESLSDSFALWDPEGRLVLSNRRFGQLLAGPEGPPCVGSDYDLVLGDALAAGTVQVASDPVRWLRKHRTGRDGAQEPMELMLRDGACIRLTERPTSDGGTVGIYTDVTQLRRVQADIRRRANEDPLTGLSNRARFLEQMESAVELRRRNRRQAALLFVDLDRFKNVNGSLGHDVGDRLLVQAAHRIRACVRTTDTVAGWAATSSPCCSSTWAKAWCPRRLRRRSPPG